MYYKIIINFNKTIKYKSITLNIIDFPKIEIPNIIFTKLTSVDSLDELDNININTVYFKSNKKLNEIENIIDKKHGNYDIFEITKKEFIKSISFYKLRSLMDLRLINYYLGLNIFNQREVFIDRFFGHYNFYMNPDILDQVFIPQNYKKKIIKNNKLKVLYCIFFSPQYEQIGNTIRTHNLLKNTKNAGINIIGVSRFGYPLDKPKEYYQTIGLSDYQKEGIEYIKLLDGDDSFNKNNLFDYIKKYTLALVKLGKKHDIDIIHTTSNWWNGIAGYYTSNILGIKSIYEVRGFWDESSVAMRPALYKSDMLCMKNNMEKFILKRVDKIITINDNLKQEILNRVPSIKNESISILYNGVDSSAFCPDQNVRKTMRTKFKIAANVVVFGYIGSLLKYEGIEYILHSIKRLINNGYKVKFIMIGDGTEKNNLLNLAHNLELVCENNRYFEYVGKIEHSDASKYYDMFDIIVYPRKNDKVCKTTSSSKIFEAMCMAKPIIVSKLPAYNEIIVDNFNGLFCIPEDLDDIFNKMKKLANDSDLRLALGNEARKWVINNREWKQFGQQLSNIYGNIIL